MAEPLGTSPSMRYVTIINDTRFEIEIEKDGSLKVNGEPREVDFLALGPSLYSILMNHRSYEALIEEREGVYEVLMQGKLYSGEVLDERAQMLATRRGGLHAESG